MSSFQLLIALEAVEFIEKLPRRERLFIRERLGEIRDSPANRSDCTEHDLHGRRVDLSICGRFAIKYWIDHADRQIKVLDVHYADRRS